MGIKTKSGSLFKSLKTRQFSLVVNTARMFVKYIFMDVSLIFFIVLTVFLFLKAHVPFKIIHVYQWYVPDKSKERHPSLKTNGLHLWIDHGLTIWIGRRMLADRLNICNRKNCSSQTNTTIDIKINKEMSSVQRINKRKYKLSEKIILTCASCSLTGSTSSTERFVLIKRTPQLMSKPTPPGETTDSGLLISNAAMLPVWMRMKVKWKNKDLKVLQLLFIA